MSSVLCLLLVGLTRIKPSDKLRSRFKSEDLALNGKNGNEDRDPVTRTENAVDFADERRHSGGDVPLRVSLHHTEVPDGSVRIRRAFRLILRAKRGEEDSI